MIRRIEPLENKGKYKIGSVHQTPKGQLVVTRRFTENGIQMIEYALNSKLYTNKIVNVSSIISKYKNKENRGE